MPRTLQIALLLLFWGVSSVTSAVCAQPSSTADTVTASYRSVYEQLIDLELDPEQTAEVRSPLRIQRDAAQFTLQKGKIWLAKPVEGRIIAALFLGKGEFYFSPPTQIEKEQLERFYETDTLRQPFKVLFLMFADSTA